MVWLKQRRKMRLRSRRSRTLARRRLTAAFREDQEAELRAVASALSADLLLMSSAQRQSVWTRSRSHAFMEVISAWDDLDWKRNFHVNRRTFRHLCDKLRVRLHHDSRLRQTITVEKRVAVALWRLGTNVEYRTISHLFGIGVSTACNIVHEVCRAIVDCLLSKYIKIPQGNDAMNIVRGFEEKWGFPQCFGAVDGSHIPILPSHDSPTDYYNCKGYHSIVLQALVNHQYHFMNVYVGWPGSVHDARIFSNSEVFAKGTSKTLLPNSVRTLAGVPVPVVIIGDPAYPLLPWLIKPYPGTGLSAKIRKINARLSRARVVVECAFGRLKGRLRSPLKRNDVKIEHMTTLAPACCILHNVCEVHQDSFDDQWLDDEVQASCSAPSVAITTPSSATAIDIRHALCDYIDSL